MQRPLIVAALAASAALGFATPAAAQVWHTEVGLRGGFVRVKPTGTGKADQIDLVDLPGGDYLGQVQTQSALFVVIPVSGPLALEPSLSLQQNTPTLVVGTMMLAGLRADIALPGGFYGGLGGLLRYRDATQSATQPGISTRAISVPV